MRFYLDMCTLQRQLDDRSQLRIHLEAEAVIGILLMCQRGEAGLLTSPSSTWRRFAIRIQSVRGSR